MTELECRAKRAAELANAPYERRLKELEERGRYLRYELRLAELRYNHNHDEDGRFCSGKNSSKPLDNGGESGIMNSGAVSGALNPYSEEAQEHANSYYESVRSMKTDVENISRNTGFDKNDIAGVKDFIFIQKHDLGGNEPEYFYPNYEMSQSWQRLIDGKNIQKHDITLLNHEIMERNLMKQGHSQDEAHRLTEQKYNYCQESEEYYAKINKHKRRQKHN